MAFNSQSLFPKEEARGTWRSQGQAALRTGGQGQRDTSGRRWAAGDEHRADSELPCTSWQPESIQLVTFTKRKQPVYFEIRTWRCIFHDIKQDSSVRLTDLAALALAAVNLTRSS